MVSGQGQRLEAGRAFLGCGLHAGCIVQGASGGPGSGPQQQGSLSCLRPFGPGSGLEGEDDVVRPLWGAPGVVVRVVSVARA